MSYDQYNDEEYIARRSNLQHNPIQSPYPLTHGTEDIPLHDATKSSDDGHNSTASHQRSKSSISSPFPPKTHTQPKAGYQQIGSSSIAPYPPQQKPHRIRDGDLAEDFNRSRQRARLLLAALARLLITLIFIALFVATLRSYQGEWVFHKQGKGWFNAVVTGLSIAFGVHLAVRTTQSNWSYRKLIEDVDIDESVSRGYTLVLLGTAFPAC